MELVQPASVKSTARARSACPGFRLCQRDLQWPVEKQNALFAQLLDAAAHVLEPAAGARASYRFLEFFTAQIRNPHTRRAYARAAAEFFDWLEAKGVTQLTTIESVHVATYALAAALLGDAIEGRTPGDELAEEGPAS